MGHSLSSRHSGCVSWCLSVPFRSVLSSTRQYAVCFVCRVPFLLGEDGTLHTPRALLTPGPRVSACQSFGARPIPSWSPCSQSHFYAMNLARLQLESWYWRWQLRLACPGAKEALLDPQLWFEVDQVHCFGAHQAAPSPCFESACQPRSPAGSLLSSPPYKVRYRQICGPRQA
ncbi:hypothetical protein BX600DRAFT_97237 [Xylariales sp. PMI_506]|nr:hypothetical protein BX600DRAFT_97237 [Xylariales sp. PMI_506]